MTEIKVSAKALAEFATHGPARKAKVVRILKEPKKVEAKVVTLYYSAAVNIIRGYHARSNDYAFLKTALKGLKEKAQSGASPQARSRAANNFAAVRAYIRKYGHQQLVVVARPRIRYHHGNVSVSGMPDIAVRENGRLRLLKLGTRKKKSGSALIHLVLQSVLLAAQENGLKISPKDVLFLDIRDEVEVQASNSTTDKKSIDLACEELESMM